jgi:hypothetical protein
MSFSQFAPDDSVTSNQEVVSTLWSTDDATATAFYTSSTQQASTLGDFYLNVYTSDPQVNTSASIEMSLAYGDSRGSGSAYFNSAVDGKSPTRDVYGQFRTLILGDENTKFTFDTLATGSDQIAIISFARSQYKQSLYGGSLTLVLSGSGDDRLTLTDNSQTQTTAEFIQNTQYYTLISGSQGTSVTQASLPSGSYGYVFPSEGLIILNALALAQPYSVGGLGITWNEDSNATVATAAPGYNYNNRILYNAITLGENFRIQASETVSSRYFFCRVKNSEYNFTSNPTIIDANGNLLYATLINNPVTYPTAVGLYNDTGDLLAVAKLSQPLQKDFTKEALIRVKLDY